MPLPTAEYRDAVAAKVADVRSDLGEWPAGEIADAARVACDYLAGLLPALPVASDVVVPPFPDDDHSHPDDPGKHDEHTAMLKLVPAAECTHFAARSGRLSEPDVFYRRDT